MTRATLLVINSGSSSIKIALYENGTTLSPIYQGVLGGIGDRAHLRMADSHGEVLASRSLTPEQSRDHHSALEVLIRWLRDRDLLAVMAAVGHRVVHGGTQFREPAVLDNRVMAELEKLCPLAPLHQPHNLEAIRAFASLCPDLPQVACFDTAFHSSQPELATRYGLPRHYHDRGIRGYGFHGLSYEYIAGELIAAGDPGKAVVAHLGNGASLCAMEDGRSIATTMGFSTLPGPPMGTRCGSLDPGIVLYMLEELGMSAREISHCLYHESGLLGVSGLSNDMRELLASGSDSARQAVDLFCYRIRREVGSLAAALGGLDTLVFTGGIGEHAAPVRASVCAELGWLGISLDAAANDRDEPLISGPESRVRVRAMATDEELMIARHTLAVL